MYIPANVHDLKAAKFQSSSRFYEIRTHRILHIAQFSSPLVKFLWQFGGAGKMDGRGDTGLGSHGYHDVAVCHMPHLNS